MIIAIDGPAGSGKSTVSKMIADRLGIVYVDTGAMYRALTLKAIEKNISLDSKAALVDIARNTDIKLEFKNKKLAVFLDGKDVSGKIRTPELTKNIKFVAHIPEVRREMVKMQQKIAKGSKGAVLEGRDIGTVVLPDADKKFYLDADFDERVRRRYEELVEAGQKVSILDIEEDVRVRDKTDMERAAGPLKKATDAITIDTTNLSIEESANKILSYVK